LTTFGIIGVKVWIYRGEILDPNASIARGTTTDPMKEVKIKDQGRGRGRDRGDRGGRRDRDRGDRG
jgi:ribosomal protein S3